jgi:hypothetical protein
VCRVPSPKSLFFDESKKVGFGEHGGVNIIVNLTMSLGPTILPQKQSTKKKRKRKGIGLMDALDIFSLCVVGLLLPF